MLAGRATQYLYYVASYHLFRQSKVIGWMLNRLGGYSIWREGADRESIKATAAILASAERPVVLFPEGRGSARTTASARCRRGCR